MKNKVSKYINILDFCFRTYYPDLAWFYYFKAKRELLKKTYNWDNNCMACPQEIQAFDKNYYNPAFNYVQLDKQYLIRIKQNNNINAIINKCLDEIYKHAIPHNKLLKGEKSYNPLKYYIPAELEDIIISKYKKILKASDCMNRDAIPDLTQSLLYFKPSNDIDSVRNLNKGKLHKMLKYDYLKHVKKYMPVKKVHMNKMVKENVKKLLDELIFYIYSEYEDENIKLIKIEDDHSINSFKIGDDYAGNDFNGKVIYVTDKFALVKKPCDSDINRVKVTGGTRLMNIFRYVYPKWNWHDNTEDAEDEFSIGAIGDISFICDNKKDPDNNCIKLEFADKIKYFYIDIDS